MEDIKITSETKDKIKDPRRVEAGKRLAAISKEAKERKARKRFLAEQEQEQEQEQDVIDESNSNYTIGFILIAGAGAYYMYENYKSKHKIQKQEHKVQSEQPKVQSEKQGEKLVDLFD